MKKTKIPATRRFGEKERLTDHPITVERVERLRDAVMVGEKLFCKIFKGDEDGKGTDEIFSTCIVKGKGRYVAETTKGTLQWTMLAICNTDLMKELGI